MTKNLDIWYLQLTCGLSFSTELYSLLYIYLIYPIVYTLTYLSTSLFEDLPTNHFFLNKQLIDNCYALTYPYEYIPQIACKRKRTSLIQKAKKVEKESDRNWDKTSEQTGIHSMESVPVLKSVPRSMCLSWCLINTRLSRSNWNSRRTKVIST